MSGLGLGLGLGLGAHRKVGAKDPGELPATFTIAAGFVNTGTKRINFSEPVTVTITGDVTLSISGTEYKSGDTIPKATGQYHTLIIDNPGADAGTITFGKRKQITFLNFASLVLPVITADITGMDLIHLTIQVPGITGDINGMDLTRLYLNNIGSSMTYGTNSFNITDTYGIHLIGDTMFSTAAEYVRLIHDAANGTWSGAYPFIITAGTNDNCPDWDDVKADVAMLLERAAWTIIPSAWLTTGGGSWPVTWKEYTG